MEQNISRELSILERREDEHVKFGTYKHRRLKFGPSNVL